jgi:hypothetical protein
VEEAVRKNPTLNNEPISKKCKKEEEADKQD